MRAPVLAEAADAGPEQERPGEGRESSLQVDDGRAGEVLHAEGVEPAAGVPDPVRDDGVDQREGGAEDEVDPELRALGHRSPDDCDGDTSEDDLEEVSARAGDGGEEGVRGLGDAEERVEAGRETAGADDRVSVPEREAETDRPVDERAEAEDEDVLAGDVRGVLHPREARLQEREAGLHEHNEHRRDHDPERVRRNHQIRSLHPSPPLRNEKEAREPELRRPRRLTQS
jgi:hypothetical protein